MSDTTQLAYIIGVLKSSPGVEWDVEEGRGGEKWLWYGKWSGGPMTVMSQHQIEKMTDEELTGLAIELTFGVG
jgi:hypothetical protein